LSVAYKNSVSARRAAWRTISAIQNKEEYKGSKYIDLIKGYRTKIEKELEDICNDILTLLQDQLIPNSRTAEAKVFYLKMKGDYFRYLGEFLSGENRKRVIQEAQDSYKDSNTEAENLKSTHPIRLSLILNWSVFYYEILSSPDIACKLAKQAFDNAIADLDGLEEDEYRDSATIMQLLRDNLTLWMSDLNDVQKEATPGANVE
jgi:14-3-3 protein epsilon